MLLLRRSTNVWATWTTSVWAHWHIAVNACFVLTKPELFRSFRQLYKCHRPPDDCYCCCCSKKCNYDITKDDRVDSTTRANRTGYLVAGPDGSYIDSSWEPPPAGKENEANAVSLLTSDIPIQVSDGFEFVDEVESRVIEITSSLEPKYDDRCKTKKRW